MSHQAQATRLLVNYFEVLARRIGMPWDPDYTAEIDAAVDHIVAEAREAARRDLAAYLEAHVAREVLR